MNNDIFHFSIKSKDKDEIINELDILLQEVPTYDKLEIIKGTNYNILKCRIATKNFKILDKILIDVSKDGIIVKVEWWQEENRYEDIDKKVFFVYKNKMFHENELYQYIRIEKINKITGSS